MGEFSGEMPSQMEHPDLTPGFTLTVRTLQCGHSFWGMMTVYVTWKHMWEWMDEDYFSQTWHNEYVSSKCLSNIYIYIYIYILIYIYIYIYIYMCVYSQCNNYICIYIHTYLPTYIHTYMYIVYRCTSLHVLSHVLTNLSHPSHWGDDNHLAAQAEGSTNTTWAYCTIRKNNWSSPLIR